MTIQIVRFKPEHLHGLVLQEEQAAMRDVVESAGYGEAIALAGQAFTVMVDGRPIACGGAAEHMPTRAEVWALLGDNAGPHMRAITKAVRGWVQQSSYLRLEASVSVDFDAGHRWMRLLGFTQEGPVRRAYMPGGVDGVTYVRIQDGDVHALHGDGWGRGLGDRGDQWRERCRECGENQRRIAQPAGRH